MVPQVIVLTLDPMGKYRNSFFPEAIALIEPKLCINHWMVLIKDVKCRPTNINEFTVHCETLFSKLLRCHIC
jgi:hypothetical protein